MLINKLNSLDDSARSGAEKELLKIGGDAGAALAKAAGTKASPQQAVSAIRTLGSTGDKKAVGMLIGLLSGDSRDRQVMKNARLALNKITGQKIPFNEYDTQSKREKAAAKWREWFTSVQDTYPTQYGLEELEEYKKASSTE